jgi:hypothetical protein
MATLIRVDRDGTKYYRGLVTCERCGGLGGSDKWAYTGWTCYECGGSGKVDGTWKEYTPEYAAKLEAKRKAKFEKWEKEHAEEIAKAEAERKAKEEAEAKAKAEEEQRIREQKAISKHIGNIGDKIEMVVRLDHKAWFEIPSFRGFGTETMYIYDFRDADGNALIWKTSKEMDIENGEEVEVKGTIKEHSEYDDEKQTVLTRCKVNRKGQREG